MKLNCFINGILTFPGEAKNWTGRATTFSQVCTPPETKAEKVEYFAGPLDRVFGQRGRAEKLYRTISFYRKWDITITGHSNGCDVIVDMLNIYKDDFPQIGTLNLVCAACEADFERNGLNQHLLDSRVQKVRVFCAQQDKALALAHSWAGKLLGYGTLGLRGPVNVDQDVRDQVKHIIWPGFGHSTCWENANFERTMQQLIMP